MAKIGLSPRIKYGHLEQFWHARPEVHTLPELISLGSLLVVTSVAMAPNKADYLWAPFKALNQTLEQTKQLEQEGLKRCIAVILHDRAAKRLKINCQDFLERLVLHGVRAD